MSEQDIESSVVFALLDTMIPSRTPYKNEPNINDLTTAELLVVLCSSGFVFDSDELKRIATDFLLSRRDSLITQDWLTGIDKAEYANLVSSFIADLTSYRAPADLTERFSNQIKYRLAQELRNRFVKRAQAAAEAGILAEVSLSSTGLSTASTTTRLPMNNALEHRLSLAGYLMATAFFVWTIEAAAAPKGNSNAKVFTEPLEIFAILEKTKTSDAILLRSIASDINSYQTTTDAKERVLAIERLAALGPKAASSLKMLRQQLELESNDEIRRCEAAWAIGHISTGDPSDLKALQRALKSSNDRLHRISAIALGSLGKAAQSALPSLDKNKFPEDVAINCITGNFPEACEAIQRMLDRESPLFRLRLEEEMDMFRRFRGGGGVCMCSLR